MKIDNEIELLKQDYEKYDLSFMVSKWIVERVPYVFKDDKVSFLQIKNELSKLLEIDSCSILFVGSACTGFSLNPYKKFKVFDEHSDIDIAVISHYYFDVAWHTLRKVEPYKLSYEIQNILREHKEKYIYWGTIATDKILGLLPFGKDWLEAIKELNKYEIFQGRDVKFRLYQDHESLRAYHITNFKKNIPSMLGVESKSITLQ